MRAARLAAAASVVLGVALLLLTAQRLGTHMAPPVPAPITVPVRIIGNSNGNVTLLFPCMHGFTYYIHASMHSICPRMQLMRAR